MCSPTKLSCLFVSECPSQKRCCRRPPLAVTQTVRSRQRCASLFHAAPGSPDPYLYTTCQCHTCLNMQALNCPDCLGVYLFQRVVFLGCCWVYTHTDCMDSCRRRGRLLQHKRNRRRSRKVARAPGQVAPPKVARARMTTCSRCVLQ